MKINLSKTPKKKLQTKERVCLTIDKELYKQFRQATKKYMQPRSALVERYIKTYVQSKIWETDIL